MLIRLLPALALLGCSASSTDELRRAWLVQALVDDNLRWLSRDLGLLEVKYQRMADDPYDFLRGTASVDALDQARAGTDRAPTAFLTSPETFTVWLAGDPHPENVGLLAPEDGPGPTLDDPRAPVLLLEAVDLDGAAFGPYTHDLRRAALGLAWIGDAGCGSGCADRAVRALAAAWTDELRALADGAGTFVPGRVPGREDPITEDLLADAIPEGRGRERLTELTELTATGRRFRLAEALDEDGRGVLRCTPEERAQLLRLLDRYEGGPGFRVLDLARRYGVGVASLPAVRYVVAWDRGDDGPEDDQMLSLREVVDPVALPRIHPQPPGRFDSNADRVQQSSQALWSRPDADPHAAGPTDGPMSFKVQTLSAWNVSYDHGKIVSDLQRSRRTPEDLEAWADTLGRQLAAQHARAPLADGGDALVVLRADLGDRDAAFVDERARDAIIDLARLRRDHALFLDALDALGPLLGADGLERP